MTSLDNLTSLPRMDGERAADLCRQLPEAVREDPQREGLQSTPQRFARWWTEFLDHDLERTDTVFEEDLAVGTDRVVTVRGIAAWSLGEHHLLPVRVELTIGYRPNCSVLGLSKFARILDAHARRLQFQKRIIDGVSADVTKATGPPAVGVVADGARLCMGMRGVRQDQDRTLGRNLSSAFANGSPFGSQLLAEVGSR